LALDLIGAGLGRTGTLTLKIVLEKLGYDRCHHMAEVFAEPETIRVWYQALLGAPTDWDKVYDGFRATVDWPGCHFWRQLVDHYPEAKVLLSLRDPEAWYQSFSKTIAASITRPLPEDNEVLRDHTLMARELIIKQTFKDRIDDKDFVIDTFNRHNDEVIAAIPEEKLLVYQVSEGWEPLCQFLEVDIPDEPFPNTNTTADFRTGMGLE